MPIFFTSAPKCTTQFNWPGSLPDHFDTEADLRMFSVFGRTGPLRKRNSESHISISY